MVLQCEYCGARFYNYHSKDALVQHYKKTHPIQSGLGPAGSDEIGDVTSITNTGVTVRHHKPAAAEDAQIDVVPAANEAVETSITNTGVTVRHHKPAAAEDAQIDVVPAANKAVEKILSVGAEQLFVGMGNPVHSPTPTNCKTKNTRRSSRSKKHLPEQTSQSVGAPPLVNVLPEVSTLVHGPTLLDNSDDPLMIDVSGTSVPVEISVHSTSDVSEILDAGTTLIVEEEIVPIIHIDNIFSPEPAEIFLASPTDACTEASDVGRTMIVEEEIIPIMHTDNVFHFPNIYGEKEDLVNQIKEMNAELKNYENIIAKKNADIQVYLNKIDNFGEIILTQDTIDQQSKRDILGYQDQLTKEEEKLQRKEEELMAMEKKVKQLQDENEYLRTENSKVKNENKLIKQGTGTKSSEVVGVDATVNLQPDNEEDDECCCCETTVKTTGDLKNEMNKLSGEISKLKKHIQMSVMPTTDLDEEATCSSPATHDRNFRWESSSSGVPRKNMKKMGYKRDRGLGKNEDGIKEAISAHNTNTTLEGIDNEKKTIMIFSDSMFKGIDKTLISEDLNVVMSCHGGCTIECMFSHVEAIGRQKPEYALLHVGTNNCTSCTSEEVIEKLTSLYEHVRNISPSTEVFLSLPTTRWDNVRADTILKNVNIKMRRSRIPHIEHTNITHAHLAKKGLHFSVRGKNVMADNIATFLHGL